MAKESKKENLDNLSIEEARSLRASRYKAVPRKLSEQEKQEEFRKYWALEKSKYNKTKELGDIIWLHLMAVKMDDPEKFERGIAHFGLKKVI